MSFKTYEMAPSASRIANGNGGLITAPSGGRGRDCSFGLDVTIVSVSDTLDVDIVATIEGVVITLGSFTQTAIVGQEIITIVNCPEDIQANWTIGGASPDFTFSVGAWRH